jgi:hypothetical protein
MFISFMLLVILYASWTFNLACLTQLISEGYFKNKFWTRSLRSVFLVPPFAIAVILFVIAKDSLSSNFDNLRTVMKKRED